MLLTGVKDIDVDILNRLTDKDLVSVCQVNKQADSLCNDQNFWFRRIITKFPRVPSEIFHKYKGDRSWSDYYINDLIKVNPYNQFALIKAMIDGRKDHVMIAQTMKGYGLSSGYKRGYKYNIIDLYTNVENGYNTKEEFESFIRKIWDAHDLIVDNYGTSLMNFIEDVEDKLGSYEPLNSGQIVIAFSYSEKLVKHVPSYMQLYPDNFIIWSK